MNKHQTKFNNTAIKMNQALISLMEKKSFEAITIKELCETAGVNRSTFYSHYQNLSELLEETRGYIIGLFVREMDGSELTMEDYRSLSDKFLIPFLRVFQRNRHIFLISDLHPGTYRRRSELQEFFQQITLPICVSFGITDLTTIHYLTDYYNAGTQSIVMGWLQNGCQESISYISSLIRFCVLGESLIAPSGKP